MKSRASRGGSGPCHRQFCLLPTPRCLPLMSYQGTYSARAGTALPSPRPAPPRGTGGTGGEQSTERLLLLKSCHVLSREEVLHQWRYAAEALQDGVHVAGVAQVPQSCHALQVWLALRLRKAGMVCTLGTAWAAHMEGKCFQGRG